MRLLHKIIAIIWVASDAKGLKMSEGKSANKKQNVTLIRFPNETGVLLSTGKLDGHTYPSFHSIRSLPNTNEGMGDTIERTIKGDYSLQGQYTKIF